MNNYVYVIDSMTNNQDNFLSLLENTLKDAKKFVIFSNALSYVSEPCYNGCIIKLYELDGDENLKGEDTVVWRVELQATQEKDFKFEISGYLMDDLYTLTDCNNNIVIEVIGSSSASDEIWFDKLVELGIVNIDGKQLISDEEFYSNYNDTKHNLIDKYAKWTYNYDYDIEFNPDGGVY